MKIRRVGNYLNQVTNILINGVATADSSYYSHPASYACDNNHSTYWYAVTSTRPHTWTYDLGAGIQKSAHLLRLQAPQVNTGQYGIRTFKLLGLNTEPTEILALTLHPNDGLYHEYAFPQCAPFRYYTLLVYDSYYAIADHVVGITEIELF
jgi:hypothetical protein